MSVVRTLSDGMCISNMALNRLKWF